jgi:hypothetical protein
LVAQELACLANRSTELVGCLFIHQRVVHAVTTDFVTGARDRRDEIWVILRDTTEHEERRLRVSGFEHRQYVFHTFFDPADEADSVGRGRAPKIRVVPIFDVDRKDRHRRARWKRAQREPCE